MPTMTYEPIETQTLDSAAASVTFSSISGSYTDLVLVINAASASAASCQPCRYASFCLMLTVFSIVSPKRYLVCHRRTCILD